MGEMRNMSFLLENLKGRRSHLEGLGIDVNIILEWILRK
jgi:hypothetical protein